MYFDVSDNATSGNYNITLTYDDGAIIDNDLSSVDMNIVNGIVTIK